MPAFACTTFLSAFLLFLVQPLIAKQILPWFGGSSSVWSVCMLFFQAELLIGYGYVHWLHEHLSTRRQVIVHGILLVLSLAMLRVAADPQWKSFASSNPSLGVCMVLALSVGAPYLMLSTTGPLMQAWYARVHATGAAGASSARPYRLYALSNLASMAALIAYPIAVEPVFEVHTQSTLWSALYAGFVAFCLSTALLVWRRHDRETSVEVSGTTDAPAPGKLQCLLWAGLAATASILLLSLTRQLTSDVAPVPFLWVLPLALYLLTFILCFDAPRYYVRPVFLAAVPIALFAIHYAIDRASGVALPVGLICAALFVLCMVCHGELTRRKPAVRHLTLFYLMLSIGGALGGTLVGLVAPAAFNAYYELPLGLLSCASLTVIVVWSASAARWRIVMLIVLAAYAVRLGLMSLEYTQGYRLVMRNFYSQTRVEDRYLGEPEARRVMLHGTIVHGEQLLAPGLRRTATAYYCESSGVAHAIQSLPVERPRKLGIVGLGAGTLAVYGRTGDTLRLYEINDQVIEAARSQFTYLSDSPATIIPVLGDARLMLEGEPSQQFDLLAIDAFSGDSIPVHLVTLEAMQMYLTHLAPEGILALHITNHYLDLQPVMAAAAASLDRTALVFDLEPNDATPHCRHSVWVLLLPPALAAALPEPLRAGLPAQARPGFRPWTDSFSNLFEVLQR